MAVIILQRYIFFPNKQVIWRKKYQIGRNYEIYWVLLLVLSYHLKSLDIWLHGLVIWVASLFHQNLRRDSHAESITDKWASACVGRHNNYELMEHWWNIFKSLWIFENLKKLLKYVLRWLSTWYNNFEELQKFIMTVRVRPGTPKEDVAEMQCFFCEQCE